MAGWFRAFVKNRPVTTVIAELRALALGEALQPRAWQRARRIAGMAAVFVPLPGRAWRRAELGSPKRRGARAPVHRLGTRTWYNWRDDWVGQTLVRLGRTRDMAAARSWTGQRTPAVGACR